MKRPLFYLAIFWISAFASLSWADEPLTVRFLDVGYGDAILLQLPGGMKGMVDTGGPETAAKVVETLKGLGISRLEFVVITHPQSDHFGGLENISRHLEIRRVYINDEMAKGDEGYAALLSGLQKSLVPVNVLRYGQEIRLGGGDVRMRVVHPRILSGSANEDSLSLVLTHGQTWFWLTADIPPQGQDEIIRDFPEVLSADCVQVPHHGGMLSGSFVSMAQDKIAVMSTGQNEYGKPFEQEIGLLQGRLLRTDRDGDIVLISDGSSLKVEHE